VDLRQIVVLTLQVSILSIVFGFGLKATLDDLLYVVRRPGLLARSLLAVFVIMPLVAVMLAQLFNFAQTVRVVLVALAVSPLPPILPKKESKAGGYTPFGLGLMATLALLAIVAVPASVELLGRFVGRQLEPASATIARAVLMSTLLPLAAGMIVRAALPAFADRVEKVVTLLGKVLLPLGVLALVAGALPEMWALIGNGNVLAIVIFTVVGLAIGHILGGPNPDHSVVLALSTACRHPAIALSLAAANFPDQRFGATILLYLIVSGIVGIPYLAWQERQSAGAVRAA
jgi:bile acid:Na+ symporter, BASS family